MTINILNSGSPTISGSRLTVDLVDNTVVNNLGTGTFTISSVIEGTGSLSHSGTGQMLLNAANTYSGGLTVNGGTVLFGNNNANGSGTLRLNGGSIQASGGSRTINEAVTVGGNFAVTGSQDLTLSGAMSLGGSQRTITVSNTQDTIFSGVISGSGGFTKEGAGSLTISGTNTFTGMTNVNNGLLLMDSSAVNGAHAVDKEIAQS